VHRCAGTGVNAETPPLRGGVSVTAGEPDDYLLSHGQSALSSAWSRFTVLFGMGRGGTDTLWSSGMTCCRAAGGSEARGSTTNREEVVSDEGSSGECGLCCFRHNTDLNRACVCAPFGGGVQASAQALTWSDT
jgi:hypothetical protein